MFKGFKIYSKDLHIISNEKYLNKGKEVNKSYKNKVHQELIDHLIYDCTLDGNGIIEDWFPEVKSHIFISHSHKDEQYALCFAGWLKETFNIDSFIDSSVWGYSNKLNFMLDTLYSWFDETQTSYSYNKVMVSKSHVDAMLTNALQNMIDKTECLFFLDSPQSLNKFDGNDNTFSPWIYSELQFSQLVRQKIPERVMEKLKKIKRETELFTSMETKNTHIKESLSISYKVPTKHLYKVNCDNLIIWASMKSNTTPEKSLDNLYTTVLPKSGKVNIGDINLILESVNL